VATMAEAVPEETTEIEAEDNKIIHNSQNNSPGPSNRNTRIHHNSQSNSLTHNSLDQRRLPGKVENPRTETDLGRTDLATGQEAVKVMRHGAMEPNQVTGIPTGMVVKDLTGVVAATMAGIM